MSTDVARNHTRTISACVANGDRLLDESYDLEFRTPPATRLYLVMIAQEEFAKAFMMLLVRENIMPFTGPVRRAVYDHTCKQLVGIAMDYIIMHWEELDELQRLIRDELARNGELPDDVFSALHLLRHEKIARWEDANWFWEIEPAWERTALEVARGARDRRKQDALYVGIARDGQVSSTPNAVTDAEVVEELERARRYKRLVEDICEDKDHYRRDRFDKVMSAARSLFAVPAPATA